METVDNRIIQFLCGKLIFYNESWYLKESSSFTYAGIYFLSDFNISLSLKHTCGVEGQALLRVRNCGRCTESRTLQLGDASFQQQILFECPLISESWFVTI